MPNTIIVGKYTKTLNNLSKYGRIKNSVYRTLEKEGFSKLRERPISKKRSVIIGYTNNSSITIGIDAAKGYIQKQSSKTHVMTFFNKTQRTINRIYSDWSGNIVKSYSNLKTAFNGKTVGSKMETVIPGKSKITKTTGSLTGLPDASRKINAEYSNGSKYTFIENSDKSKTFDKEAKGIKFNYTL